MSLRPMKCLTQQKHLPTAYAYAVLAHVSLGFFVRPNFSRGDENWELGVWGAIQDKIPIEYNLDLLGCGKTNVLRLYYYTLLTKSHVTRSPFNQTSKNNRPLQHRQTSISSAVSYVSLRE